MACSLFNAKPLPEPVLTYDSHVVSLDQNELSWVCIYMYIEWSGELIIYSYVYFCPCFTTQEINTNIFGVYFLSCEALTEINTKNFNNTLKDCINHLLTNTMHTLSYMLWWVLSKRTINRTTFVSKCTKHYTMMMQFWVERLLHRHMHVESDTYGRKLICLEGYVSLLAHWGRDKIFRCILLKENV